MLILHKYYQLTLPHVFDREMQMMCEVIKHSYQVENIQHTV